MAVSRLNVEEFLSMDSPVLDVRSPGEYHNGHIPGAISFPLFTNEERAQVGTMYKKEGKSEAVKLGLEIVGPKMRKFIEEAESLGSKTLRMHCWRGGMRSESLAWLLEQTGFDIFLLAGGYKAYRKFLMDYFEKPLNLVVLTGYTGSRKTELLHILRDEGEQVLDLEDLANHQGSSFGNKKSTGQPSTEQFQNQILEQFRKFSSDQPVWVEDESMRIGQVSMPESLYRQKSASPHVLIEISLQERIEFLTQDYGDLSKDQLCAATSSIAKKLGTKNAESAIEAINSGNLSLAAEIILQYYDKRYHASIMRKQDHIIARYKVGMSELPGLSGQLKKITLDGIQIN